MSFAEDTLGSYVDFSNGKSSPERANSGAFPVYGSNGLIGFSSETNAPSETSVIGRVGSYCGSIHFSKNECWVTDNAIKATAKNPKESRFWFYAMLNRDLHDLRSGSGQPLINQAALKSTILLVPPKLDRIEIAAILGALDDKIELNRKASATLEAMARALYRSWFVDFDPVWAKVEGRPPAHMDAQTAALFPDSFDDGGLPLGWTCGTVEDLFFLQRGFDLPATVRTAGHYPVYSASGQHGTHNEFKVRGPGITTGRSGVIGEVFLVLEDFWPLNTSLWVKEFKRGSAYFTFFFLQNLDLLSLNSGSAVPSLNRNYVHMLHADIPPQPVVDAYDRSVSPIFEQMLNLKSENHTLATLRDCLLPKLMSGEIRVGDARALIEGVA